MSSPYLNISTGIKLCIVVVASSSMCGMNWKWYPYEEHKFVSTNSKRGRLVYLVKVSLLIIIRRGSSYPVFVSRVRMSALVSDCIKFRKDFWRRMDFINFLLPWSIFVLFFTGKKSHIWPPWKPISDLPYLFERVVKFHWWRILFIYTCSAFSFSFCSIGIDHFPGQAHLYSGVAEDFVGEVFIHFLCKVF